MVRDLNDIWSSDPVSWYKLCMISAWCCIPAWVYSTSFSKSSFSNVKLAVFHFGGLFWKAFFPIKLSGDEKRKHGCPLLPHLSLGFSVFGCELEFSMPSSSLFHVSWLLLSLPLYLSSVQTQSQKSPPPKHPMLDIFLLQKHTFSLMNTVLRIHSFVCFCWNRNSSLLFLYKTLPFCNMIAASCIIASL